jgi:hypothetical protein
MQRNDPMTLDPLVTGIESVPPATPSCAELLYRYRCSRHVVESQVKLGLPIDDVPEPPRWAAD